jgi:hypothetical protein
VVIQDEVRAEVSGKIVWAVHTSAEPISVAGSVARFRSGDDRFVLRILEPEAACFEIGFPPEPKVFPIADVRQLHGRPSLDSNAAQVAELPRRDDDDDRRAVGALIRRLQIAWPKGTQRLSVALLPDCDDDDLVLPVTSLDDWLARRPVRLASYSRRASWINAARHAARGASTGFAPSQTRLVRKPAPERAAVR